MAFGVDSGFNPPTSKLYGTCQFMFLFQRYEIIKIFILVHSSKEETLGLLGLCHFRIVYID